MYASKYILIWSTKTINRTFRQNIFCLSDINVTPNTVFAPTNEAFQKLPNDTMDIIRKNKQYCERKDIT